MNGEMLQGLVGFYVGVCASLTVAVVVAYCELQEIRARWKLLRREPMAVRNK